MPGLLDPLLRFSADSNTLKVHLSSDVTIQLDGFEMNRRHISSRIIYFFKVITLSPQWYVSSIACKFPDCPAFAGAQIYNLGPKWVCPLINISIINESACVSCLLHDVH